MTDECKTNAEFEYVWASVDSGSFVNIASHDKPAPHAKLRPSELHRQGARCAAANGSEIPMEEEILVKYLTDHGDKAEITFHNGDVHLPIISVARLSDHHGTLFHESGGALTHRKSKKQTHFVKKDGVYFMRLKVPVSKNHNWARSTGEPDTVGFVRPGN